MPLPDANGYISPTDADAFLGGSFGGDAWAALTPTEKQVAISEASRALETLDWWGERCSPTQQWQWPRKLPANGTCAAATCTTLPPDVVGAVSMLALSLHLDKAALVPALGATGSSTTTNTGPVKRQKLGDLEQEFFAPGTTGHTTTSVAPSQHIPAVMRQFNWLRDSLRCWLIPTSNSGARVLSRGAGDGCGCSRLDGLPFPTPLAMGISDSSRMLPTASGMWGDYVDTTGARGVI